MSLLNLEMVGGTLVEPADASARLGAGQLDPTLEGHLLQRSDGAFFIVHNGAKYAVQPAGLSDDDINAIPDGPGDLFAASGAPAAAPPSAPTPAQPDATAGGGVQPLPQSQTVSLANGVVLGVPQGYTVASTTPRSAQLDKNSIVQIGVEVQAVQPTTGAIITKAEDDLANATRITFSWSPIQDLGARGKATSITNVPFTGSLLSGAGFVNYSGALTALTRADAAVVVVLITRGAAREDAALETVLQSLTR